MNDAQKDETDREQQGMHPSSHNEDNEDVASLVGSEITLYNEGTQKAKDENIIANEETKNVLRLKLLVITVLVTSTIGVAAAVYLYISNAEQNSFEEHFTDDSHKVLEAIGSALDLTLGSVDSFLVAMVSFAHYSNATWPFVTIPDYAIRLAKIQSQAKAVLVTQYHYVTGEERSEWEAYTVANDGWVQEGIEVQKKDETFHGKIVDDFWTRGDIHNDAEPYHAPGPYLPKWQQAPVIPIYAPYNWDAMTYPSLHRTLDVVMGDRQIALSDVSNLPYPNDSDSEQQVEGNNDFIKDYVGEDADEAEPFSDLYFPILDYASDFVTIPKTAASSDLGKFVGVFAMTFYWRDLIKDILPIDSNGIVVVIENGCGQSFSYQVNGPETLYLGQGDLHETKYDHLEKSSSIVELDVYSIRDRSYTGLSLSDKGCSYFFRVYPSSEMEGNYKSNDPIIFTITAVIIFAFTSMVFIIYDCMVERRQKKIMKTAVQTNAIVSSLFPSNVRDRLFPSEQDGDQQKNKNEQNKLRLTDFLSGGKTVDFRSKEEEKDRGPIADLFPNCTVLFSDIAGFTAWSSVREPSQVFTLLETLYSAIDAIAMKRGVFKVETIGDAYVAVVGLPEPREDHAVVMAKFARDSRWKMIETVRNLEKTLGPGTADLKLRFGLHSGPVTAGVLRGQKSRFQLFGDTVNTAARMESTGCPNKIQASKATAELLIEAGKTSWVNPRENLVEPKGKGKMQTYWIEPKLLGITASATSDPFSEDAMDEKTRRLVDWNTEVLARLLKQVIARKNVFKSFRLNRPSPTCIGCKEGMTVLDEVTEIIELPEVNPATYIEGKELNADIFSQLRDYVIAISNLYNNNPFHNFDHASHVGMSIAKLLGRLVVPEEEGKNRKIGSDYAYGITSDPSTLFACVYSALIHDIDHPGVPNSRLIHDNSPLATRYRGKSIAEQNSVDIAWNLLMQEQYNALRDAICPTEKDLKRFRQLVINIVMATDILDSDLIKNRNERWDKAFSESYDESERDHVNRRATVVIEHLIQASDVAHTMQHWNIYCKWNEKLFEESYLAYKSGRADKDPSEFWYQGELDLFDSFVLPLARKLRDSGIFEVSSDEYLIYATSNREDWELQGRDVVASMVKNYTERSSASA